MKEFILLNQTFETNSINEKEMAELPNKLVRLYSLMTLYCYREK